MFAIFTSGGKQYKARAGDILKLEKLEGEAGSTLSLDNILLFGGKQTQLGADAAKGKLVAEILEQGKGEKVIVFKKKRRHNYRRKNGHRQLITTVRITEITSPSGETVKAEPLKKKAEKPAAEASKKVAKAAPTSKKAPAKAKEDKPAAVKKPAAKKPSTKKKED